MTTLREQRIAALANEIRDIEDAKRLSRELDGGCNANEQAFRDRAKSKSMRVLRAGWPDFLVEADGKLFAVEVKANGDVVRPNQATMFMALESAGIRVLLWNPAKPETLTPWRKSWRSRASLKRIRRAEAQQRVIEALRQGAGI